MSLIDKFDYKTREFSIDNARFLAEAALLAYEDEAKVKATTAEWGLTNFKFYNDPKDEQHPNGSDTQAFIASNDKILLVAFRGTESMQDALTDANIAKVNGPKGKVHMGFWNGLLSVWGNMADDILNRLDVEDRTKRPKVWITGHSLGAALATLAAADLRMVKTKGVRGLYTFGSPRAGDTDFEEEFDNNVRQTFRIVNNNDIVTRVPPRSMGFSHIGELRYLNSEGGLETAGDTWGKVLDRFKGTFDSFKNTIATGDFGVDALNDHKMGNYISQIEKNL